MVRNLDRQIVQKSDDTDGNCCSVLSIFYASDISFILIVYGIMGADVYVKKLLSR